MNIDGMAAKAFIFFLSGLLNKAERMKGKELSSQCAVFRLSRSLRTSSLGSILTCTFGGQGSSENSRWVFSETGASS